jgi:hypothetical protein
MAAQWPPGGHDPDDEAPTKLPRATRPTQHTAPLWTHHPPADATKGALPDHGDTTAAAHGALVIRAGNDQIECMGSISGSPRV